MSAGWIPELTMGARLEISRVDAHVSRGELARACGVRVADTWRWFRNEAVPTAAQVAAWAACCGVDPVWLASGDQLDPWYVPPSPDEYRWTPEIVSDPSPAPPQTTLAGAVDAYVTDRQGRGEIGAETARQVRWRLAGLCDTHPGLGIAQLTIDHLRAWQHQIGHQRPASRRAYLSTVRVFCAWCAETGLIEVDPSARLSGRVREPRRVPRALTASQASRLLMVLPDQRARLIVALMLRLGLRRVEVTRLAVGDYDTVNATLHVRGKADNERFLPVPPDVAALLAAHVTGRTDQTPIIGQHPIHIGKLVTDWMLAAGIKTGPHDGMSAHALRHTAASNLLDACGNVRTVQAFLGHASLATTDRYLRRADLGAMRQALEGSPPR